MDKAFKRDHQPVKTDETYTLVLNSYDSINQDFTPFNKRAPEEVDVPNDARDADIPIGDPFHIPNNDAFDRIRDTRSCVFNVDWRQILPHHYKRFKMTCYFVSQLCVQANEGRPDIDGYRRSERVDELYNTSDGRKLSESSGYFMKIAIDGLNSQNVFDSKTQGRSNFVSIVRRNPVQYITEGDFENRYVYETVSTQMVCPTIDYPSQNLLTVHLRDDQLEKMYFESFLFRDFASTINENTVNERFYIEEDLPVMAEWSLVLTFQPIE